MGDPAWKTEPFPHQRKEFEDHKDADGRGMLWTMRTGKTKSCLDKTFHRHLVRGDVDGLLVVAPNGVHWNWVRREIPTHAWEAASVVSHAWVSSQSGRPDHDASLEAAIGHRRGLAVLAVNSEALQVPRVQEAIKRFLRGRRVKLVVDESHDFRTPGSKRTRLIRALAKRCPVREILTGTPVSNSPLAAYSQFEILERGALGFTTFGAFKDRYAHFEQARTKGGRAYPILKEYRNTEELTASIGRWASVLREDCEGLPDIMRTVRFAPLTEAQSTAYRTLREEMLLELERGEVTAVEAGARLTKLQQIASGFVIQDGGEVADLVSDEENPRLVALVDEVRGTDGKAIVWCRFREDIRRAVRALEAAGLRTVEYHGVIPQSRRQEAIDRFQSDPAVRVFVGQPAAGGEGLDLAAAAIVWYSHTFDLIERDQANERATRVGGRRIAVVDIVAPSTVDERILATLESKRSVAEAVAGRGLRDLLREA